jgi:hypothetical protein
MYYRSGFFESGTHKMHLSGGRLELSSDYRVDVAQYLLWSLKIKLETTKIELSNFFRGTLEPL